MKKFGRFLVRHMARIDWFLLVFWTELTRKIPGYKEEIDQLFDQYTLKQRTKAQVGTERQKRDG